MTDEQRERLELAAQGFFSPDESVIAYSIAVSLRRLADDMEQIKNGMKFINERWGER